MAVGLQSYLWPCKDDSDGKIDLYYVPCVPFCPNWIEAYTDNIYIKALQSTIFINSNIQDDGKTIINRTALAISDTNNVKGSGYCTCESPFQDRQTPYLTNTRSSPLLFSVQLTTKSNIQLTTKTWAVLILCSGCS